jgi:HD-GYP domain-containing protein (c-di-GMP phosphodiesterase class II)
MDIRTGRAHTTIRMTVVVVFVLATAITAAIAIGLQFYFGQQLAKRAAENLYTVASTSVAAELRGISRVNNNIIELLADNVPQSDIEQQNDLLESFTRVLERNPIFYGVYLGRGDGSFYEVVNLEANENARGALDASLSDRWVVISDRKGDSGSLRTFTYLDANLESRSSRSEPTDFDVRTRPWYTDSMGFEDIQRSDVYQFAQLGVPGRTLSKRVAGTDTVIAVDMTLSSISDYLSGHRLARHADIYLYNESGQIIGSSVEATQGTDKAKDDSASNTIQALPTDILIDIAATPAEHGQLQEIPLDGESYLIYAAPPIDGNNDRASSGLFVGILAPLDSVAAPYLDKVKTSIAITGALLVLLLPFSWLFANPIVKPIRQLAIENDKVRLRQYGDVGRVDSRVKELDELSESMVNMVAAIQAHEVAQRELMDSFIQLIAQAIDDKSPYTAGHCERVPVLALMLAEHASGSNLPAFQGFRLETEDQWREYRIAAWLHDCGKITTPEHIVDKGSKLETIYNRIHEVRMRFETLWRDAEINYWQALHRTPGDEISLKGDLERRQKELQDDWAFVAECNVGGEFLDRDKQARLKRIGGISWQRHFDDRIGLSPVEELRIKDRAPDALPVAEKLLSDKPEHLVERTRPTDYPPEFGINMDIPERLYNQGEIYNLSISRGTLTAEDRFKINEHMISTIKMLESLPFPPELGNVPRWASTHHETMGGTGYPRKLPGEQLSIPERIMAVADVFEALTAADRPYKKAKPVSIAVDILHKMVLDDHIDQECFELFIREGVYLEYAKKFLAPEQIDEVDVSKYLLI